MKMKLIVSLVVLGLSPAVVMAAPIGTITFTGKLTDSTCDVKVNDSANGNATITLPTLPVSQLAAANATAGNTNFTMKLSNCTPKTGTVRAYFEAGANVDAATGRLKNTALASEAAGKVDVQLLDAKDNVLEAGNTSQRSLDGTALTDGAATLGYQARYFATGKTTAGKLNTSVTYSIDYN
ncbi:MULTISPECIES: fimbrial protein [unclassified Serratia (in: enterobacteria)]|uniref:fimbrial protein n=1 Tax=unclassified Serratia (in: enterobacteria) TaxID=2647522 RepID=UPI002ED42E83|nr:fimbrial protein [Serratia sp. C2(2)]MEE4449345.1 fimbrial protein [Serratia sp. C2(1)]